jgi:hypothetical protein
LTSSLPTIILDLIALSLRKTVLHSFSLFFKTFNACNTIRPATMAFVVAIAGIILPANAIKNKFIVKM